MKCKDCVWYEYGDQSGCYIHSMTDRNDDCCDQFKSEEEE